MNRPSRGSTLAAVAILAVTITACSEGNDPGSNVSERPGDKPAIRNVLVTAFKTEDPEGICSRLLTRQLFRQIYESKAACRRVEAKEEEDEPVKRVEVSSTQVSGNRARARARLLGGDQGGTAGIVSLAREDGTWRIDDLSIGFLRSALTAALENDKEIPRSVNRCALKHLLRLPDGRFKDLAYGSLGERPDAQRLLFTELTSCEHAEGRPSTIRREINKEVAKSLRQAGARPAAVKCVIRSLTRRVSERKLIALISAPADERVAGLRRVLIAAASACRVSDGGPGESIS